MKKQIQKILVLSSIALTAPLAVSQTLQPWMNNEVSDAWRAGYKGQGTTITFVDDFRSSSRYYGNFNGSLQLQQHGKWTSQESSLIAPLASINTQDFSNSSTVRLASRGLNTVNLSYAMYANTGSTANGIRWAAREQSIINYASNGSAVIVKAAGNDYGTSVGSGNVNGKTDYLNSALIDTKSAIFVGALDKNGAPSNQASMASYSNVAGSNTAVQNKFLVVGVTGGNDPYYKLYGTSFAAPVVSGYSAILGSKFTTANSTKITNQLLNTARTDTIANYSTSVHGKGEASITRALAPASIR